MSVRNVVVATLVVLAVLGGGVAIAPAATATHHCGDLPCPHIEDVFCLPIVKKYLGQFCPYF